MKRFWVFALLALMSVVSFAQDPVPTEPTPSQTVQGAFATLDIFFPFLKQGRVGLIQVTNATAVTGTFLDRPITFFSVPSHQGFYALVTPPLTQNLRTYDLSITAQLDNISETLLAPIDVISGDFIQQSVIVVGEANTLLNRELEDAELARLFELANPETPIVYWQDNGFNHPVDAELTSPFGAVRLFNGLYETLHTGWDYQAPLGKPMVASSGGVVAFAGRLDIRGNYVLIDHGYGIYSGYAHLSLTFVTQGETVTAGQIIGTVGSTGRSSSAHAHIEFIVNDQWVDSRDFIGMYLPK